MEKQAAARVDQDRWYVVHTLPRREFNALRHLEFQGFRAFLPVCDKTIRHARKFSTVTAPFFPRYLFVRLSIARDRWRSINGTSGVARLIMEGDRPKPVPHGVVEALGANRDTRGVLSFRAPFEPGQRVRILNGPFANQIGSLLRVDERDRVQILLDLMGARVSVSSPEAALAPAA